MVQPKAVYESERCKVFLWDGVTPGETGGEFLCDTFIPKAVQAEGNFLKVRIEGSCGGAWEPLASFSFPGMQTIEGDVLRIRPVVEGPETASAKIFLLARR